MYLKHILLEQFRCYERQELALPEGGLRLAGANASGKTSLVEGIQLLSRVKSPRAGVERELINWTSNEEFGLPPYGRVVGQIAGSASVDTIEVTLSADPQRPSHTRKRILADGQPRRAIDALGAGAVATGWVILLNAASYGAVVTSLMRMGLRRSGLSVPYLAMASEYGMRGKSWLTGLPSPNSSNSPRSPTAVNTRRYPTR
jgi:hypothetical protein